MVFEDGLIVEGALVATFVPMVAIGLISLLAIPGHALLAASGWLWTRPTAGAERDANAYVHESGPYESGSPDPEPYDDHDYEVERFPCPTCGKRLRTESGLAQHQAVKHPS